MSGRTDHAAHNAYMRAYVRERYARRKAAAIGQLGGRCVACGTTYRLEFDHIDPSKKSYAVSSFDGLSEKKLQAELLKCQLLCYDHHKAKTKQERKPWRHGTPYGYFRKECRCTQCIEAKDGFNRHRVSRAVSPEKRRRRLVPEHGTMHMYYGRGCRCEPCRQAGMDYRRSRAK